MSYPTKKFDVQSAEYDTVKTVLSGTVVAGDFVALNEVNGFYFSDGVSGDTVTVVTRCPRTKVKRLNTEVWAEGEAVYYDGVNHYVTNVAGSLALIGYAKEAVAATVDYGMIAFDGFAAHLKA